MNKTNTLRVLQFAAIALMAGLAYAGLLPHDAAIGGAMMMGTLGGTGNTLELLKAALGTSDDNIAKSITQASNLTAYDLQGPSKNLYPVNTPIRNKLPRVPGIGPATNWRQITAINGSGYDAMGWVPEGQRSGRMSYSAVAKSAAYVTLGEEDQVSFEAISAGTGFEDVRATGTMRVLQKMMLKEENALLFGNASLSLGTPATPTASAAGSGATLAAATYSVIVVALTGEGFKGASMANGIPLSQTVTGADGQTFTVKGGSSMKSAAASQAITLGQTLSVSVAAIQGAVAYAWFIGVSGSEKLEKITTINSATFAVATIGGAQQAATLVVADSSTNSLGFDGLLTTALKSGSGAYVNSLATGVAGTGTVLTASGRGTVNEIDAMLQSMWDNWQVSPTCIYVNSQELKNITTKALSGASSAPLLQIFTPPGEGYGGLVAGGVIGWYFNPFAMNGGIRIPVILHPSLPSGTIIGWCDDLPIQYKSTNVPNVAEVKVRRDYYQLDYPLRTRSQEFGVYAEETLAVYAPFAMGVITNIANG